MKPIGPLMVDLAGTALSAEEREMLRHPLVGGVILFARNYSDPGQLRALCSELSALKRPRLLLAVDHEGGRVQRFRIGFTRIPPMGTLGRRYAEDRRRAVAEARRYGRVIGRELSGFGIDLSFAPVLDRDTGRSQVIGDRAFAADPRAIVALSRSFMRGLASAGHAATGKHFPGHGAVVADSHRELPVDRRSWEEIESTDLAPFVELIALGIPSLMMAHVRYSSLDEAPASFSRFWIRDVLRRRLKFDGAVFSDDLSMGGAVVVGSMTDRARLALDAGCDMLIACNDRAGTLELLDNLEPVPRTAATRRLRRLYRKKPAPAKR